jgi:hypothetical protein
MATDPKADALPIPARFDDLVQLYIKLRDKIKEADDAHAAKMKPSKAYLERLNSALLAGLNATGQDAAKTPYGTAYRSSRKSASIADGTVFREFVIANQYWDLLDWKANATAVADFIASGSPPPGINFTTTFTAGVRRE